MSSFDKGLMTKLKHVIGERSLSELEDSELKDLFTNFYASRSNEMPVTQREANIRISSLKKFGREVGFRAEDLNVKWAPDTQTRNVEKSLSSQPTNKIDVNILTNLLVTKEKIGPDWKQYLDILTAIDAANIHKEII